MWILLNYLEPSKSGSIDVFLLGSFIIHCSGWGAIRKWPMIRPSPTHTVCVQNKITGSGIRLKRTIEWSEVTSVWGCCDQRSLLSGDGMIRGHFGLGMVWSEVTSVWGLHDQRSLRSGDGMIRGHFGLGMVWSEVTLGLEWSDRRRIPAHSSLFRDHFEREFFCEFLFYFTERCWLCQAATKSSILITDTTMSKFNHGARNMH